jgi:hypothetical protein
MNHVLSLPHTLTLPGLLEPWMKGQHRTVVTRNGMVRLEGERGRVEMRFSDGQPTLPPGTEVYVWWKGGGFVCASVEEMHAEQQHAETVAARVTQARARLDEARRARADRQGIPSDFTPLPLPAQEIPLRQPTHRWL